MYNIPINIMVISSQKMCRDNENSNFRIILALRNQIGIVMLFVSAGDSAGVNCLNNKCNVYLKFTVTILFYLDSAPIQIKTTFLFMTCICMK